MFHIVGLDFCNSTILYLYKMVENKCKAWCKKSASKFKRGIFGRKSYLIKSYQ